MRYDERLVDSLNKIQILGNDELHEVGWHGAIPRRFSGVDNRFEGELIRFIGRNS